MADEKDRLGGKLHDVEAARENQWARQRDEELLEKMRERLHQHACPNCKQFLVAKTENGVQPARLPRRPWRVARRADIEDGAEGAQIS